MSFGVNKFRHILLLWNYGMLFVMVMLKKKPYNCERYAFSTFSLF